MDIPVFCTIITTDYYSIVRAQFAAIKKYNLSARYHVFLTADKIPENVSRFPEEGLILHTTTEVCQTGVGKEIKEKYSAHFSNRFRWAMKPVILKYLLEDKGLEKAVYIDWDIYFCSSYSFLFKLLDNDSVLITPQWNAMRTRSNLVNLINTYNAGFVGVRRDAIDLMEWWARECLFKCEIDYQGGYYVDQSYLHYFHLHENISVKVVKHRGCNVADWNQQECRRSLIDGKVLINNRDPLVFIHFSFTTIRSVLHGRDPLLLPYFEEFDNAVGQFNNGVKLTQLSPYNALLQSHGFFRRLKDEINSKVRLRKRWKAFMRGIG